MGRPGLSRNRKFPRLAKSLGSAIVARGVLELMWDACYENGDDYLGTAEDVEARIGWTGDSGVVVAALVNAGLPEGVGFIEARPPKVEGGPVTYRVHDFWHHAPDYVSKRRNREIERRQKSVKFTPEKRVSAERRRKEPNGRTPSPSPSPSPQVLPSEVSSEAQSATKPPTPTFLEFPVVGAEGQSWSLSEAQVADWMKLFPGLDVRQDLRNALAWVLANPGRRKTGRGMARFLVSWLTRTNDRGHGARGSDGATTSGVAVNTRVSPAVAARIRAAQEVH